ncbi:uncharacterized protein [Engystomops pustulosus]|uniref:uncharacterized protein isoform X1 n=1 Tax=Engystomops pustulosus TaxID=76066 RepID=UPI003AFA3C9D
MRLSSRGHYRTGWRSYPGSQDMKSPPYPLYLLLLSLSTADGLRVTMKAPLISVTRDVNVTIPCEFSELTSKNTINVYWRKSLNGQNTEVYKFVPGAHEAYREGCYMEEEEDIRRGNAALHIPRVQFSDDGEYTCTVIVTPEGDHGKSSLQVSAVPSAVLTPGDAVTVEIGSERSVSCKVRNFYPKDISIRWVQHKKDSPKQVVQGQGSCSGEAVNNTDGTYNVTSQLTLYPTIDDSGYKYSCVVKHRSLPHDLTRDFTLTVTEREDNTGTVVAAVILTLLTVILLSAAAFLLHQAFTKDPPTLSEITGSDEMIDMNRTTLTCHITGFRPNDLEISVCLRRRGAKEQMVLIWRSRDFPSSVMMGDNAGGSSVAIDVERQRLMNGDAGHTQTPLHLDMSAVVTPNRPRLLRCITWRRLYTYSCQCSLHITPSCSEDDGAELSVHVSHPALTAEVHQEKTLRVIGVPPTLLSIVSPVYKTHEVPMTLTCSITGFKPKPLEITWLKRKRNQDQEMELVTWKSNQEEDTNHNVTENEHQDKSYSFQSALLIKPNVREDDGATYICRTHHPATGHQAEETLLMAVTAVPVMDPIKSAQDKVHAGEIMKLSCKIHSFYPPPVEVTWSTEDGERLESIISDVLPDQSGLCHLTSTMSYTPTMKDQGKTFMCDVRHKSTGSLRSAMWTLVDLVSEPSITEISCDPPSPQLGEEVTLSCGVSDLHGKDLQVYWYKGITRISGDKCRRNIVEDPESRTFGGTIEVKFPADPGCHEEDFRMELIHYGKTIERTFRMVLGDSPILSEITSDPRDPHYGQSVTLRCQVTGDCDPRDMAVKWLKGEKPLEKGEGAEKRITEKDGSVSCSLQITATALDYGRSYSCNVTHKGVPHSKKHYVHLPDKAPTLSAITVRPERPVSGKEAVFTVTISGFTPDIRVKWYKDFSTFPRDAITTSDLEIGQDFLFTCSTSLRFIPQDSDHEALLRCEVTHTASKKFYEQKYKLLLSDPVSRRHDHEH